MEEIRKLIMEILMVLEELTVDELLQFKAVWIEAAKESSTYAYTKLIIDKIMDYELERKTKTA